VNLADHIHPEFGYFCPMPRFRRDLRVAFFAFACGAGLGAIAVIALIARNYEVHTAPAAGIESTLAAVQPQSATHGSSLITDTIGSENDQTNAKACEQGSFKRHCAAQKLREARTPSPDNGPLIARLPLGRPATSEEATSRSARADISGATELSHSSHGAQTAVAHTPVAQTPADTSVSVADASQAPRSAPLPRKKPRSSTSDRKIGGPLNRDEPSERAAAVPRASENASSPLGRMYARDSSHGRTVFWDWSR
jgi:hypothetical protein